ncbi:LPS assembly lipoprotein LptE [Chelativorans intermedius]|uniref:LPS assembly lipoprotein LptE n=1 Tax=Chelativorans intermedius TaxID=515947 RepID=A0ABV6D759_9HYPH|nr:LPS assembly lipoprotein LptE [Chelativorans intermedius]MCT8999334.1 LPS assembly lipoprotein LptE [Chelativorans intermedius]
MPLNAAIRAFALAASGLLLALAAGCTVRPLLAEAPPGAAVRETARLDAVSVAPVSTRPAQQVRNHLIFLLHGGAGEPANPGYRLELDVTSRVGSAVDIQSGGEDEPTAGTVTLTGRYRLIDSITGEPVSAGTQSVSAGFDRPRQEFAVLRAERNAQDRAARELAEFIHLAIARDLAGLDGR